MRQYLSVFVLTIAFSSFALAQVADAQNQKAESPSECVAIIGAVVAPARLALKRRIRLEEALTIVAGVTHVAGPTVEITHFATKCPEESTTNSRISPAPLPTATARIYQIAAIKGNDETLNPYLEAGDLVVVRKRDSVFVVGAVVQPREVPLEAGLTLTQVIAKAGGLRKEAKVEKVRVYRHSSGTGRLELLVNLKEVRKKKAQDPVLQPDDIVDVPGLNPRGPMFSIPQDTPLPPPPLRVIYGL